MSDNTDTGRFQINDIELYIPPEQIKVSRNSVNNMWQTLRTRSSIKVKSGISTINVSLNVKFTNTIVGLDDEGVPTNGLLDLRNLVSQFRITPFCYIENLFLRNAILAGSDSLNMAFALKQMQILKTADPSQGTSTVDVVFHFCWFNYLPYARDFTFKKNFFSEVETKDPRQSVPWKTLYKAEQTRLYYSYVSTLDGYMDFKFSEFAQIQIKQYDLLRKDISALKTLREEIINGQLIGADDNRSIGELIFESFQKSLGDGLSARSLAEDIFGFSTSMKASKSSVQKLLGTLDSSLIEGARSIANENIWSPIITKEGKPIRYKNEPSALLDEIDSEDTIMLERNRSLVLGEAGLIVNHISISFENILANMPLMGHAYPTFQHIGSVDAVVTLSIMTTSEASVKALSSFYSTVEEQSIKFKQVPQGQRNITIYNDIINMCGLNEFIANSLVIETIPGQPGTYSATLELIDNPITSETKESITNGQSFTSSEELRAKISDILIDNLTLIPGVVSKDDGVLNSVKSILSGIPLNRAIFGGLVLGEDTFSNGILRGLKADKDNNPETGYYIYTGNKNLRNFIFQSLCEEYGNKLGKILSSLVAEFVPVSGQFGTGPLAEFFSLRSTQVFGIERIQDDIRSILKQKNKILKFGDKRQSLLDTESIRRSAEDIISESNDVTLRNLNKAREERIENGGPDVILTSLEDSYIKWIGRVSDFINDNLSNWMSDSRNFIDDIIRKGYLDLDQFRSIKESIKEATVESSGHCYPDFPINEVIQLLQSSDNPTIVNALDKLKEEAVDKKLLFKNLGVSSLLGPDFYFFNNQNDTISNIIPNQVIEQAVIALNETQGETKINAEKRWFNNVYDKHILGQDRSNKVKEQIVDVSRDRAFWSENAGNNLQSSQTAIRESRAGASVFHPDDLQDIDGQGLGCSILEHNNATGDKYGPITLERIDDNTDFFDSVSARRDEASLIPDPAHHAQAKHFFGLDVLNIKPAGAYTPTNNGSDNDENNTPQFVPPIANWKNHKTSSAQIGRPAPEKVKKLREAATKKGEKLTRSQAKAIAISKGGKWVRNHNGQDFGGVSGTPIRATANGTIVGAAFGSGGGNTIKIKHAGGYFSYYLHMLDDEHFGKFRDALKIGDKKILQVKASQRIGSMGNSGKFTTGTHLHFEIRKGRVPIDPAEALEGRVTKLRQLTPAISPQNESLLTKSVEQLERDLYTGQGYSMARAYPTFRFYFIESDMGERKRFGFDDMFGYSSVKEIQLVRSRKIASDLLVVQLTNISGVLSNRRFDNSIPTDSQGNEVKESPGTPQRKNTVNENPLASLHLQPGIQVQMRLGYSSNPEDLEIVFNGIIAEVSFNETDELVTLVCQSFAVELVKNIHGEAKSYGGLFSGGGYTARILEEMLAMPEVVHFGRWEGGDGNLGALRGALTTRWKLVQSPQDDNIFAPVGRGIFGLFDSTEKYQLYQSTIWDVFQEMTLRHPGYVASPVPYKDQYGDRMTMFFGSPDQMYFARDPDLEEKGTANILKKIASEAQKIEQDNKGSSSLDKLTSSTKKPTVGDLDKINKDTPKESDKNWLTHSLSRLALDQGIIKPFRNYHVLTSTNHIIYNNISSSTYNTFNTVTLQYGDDEAKPSESSGELLIFGDINTFTLRGDAALPDEDVRELFAQYPNCVGYEMAKRYCVSLLWWALKEGYKGNIVIIGNEKIKPFDLCFIFDEYSDMFGPIEVEQVVHRFSQETGFVSEITPDMVLHVNQAATLATTDAMGLLVAHSLRSIGLQSLPNMLGPTNKTAASTDPALSKIPGISFSPIAKMILDASIGLSFGFIFKKLITRTQLAQPFRASPLVKNGKSMIGGLPNRKTDGSFYQSLNKWAKEADEGIPLMLSDLYDTINPNQWVGRTTGSFGDFFFGEEQ